MSQSRYEGKDLNVEENNRHVSAFFDRLVRGHSFSGREPNCVFLNTGKVDVVGGQFVNASAISGFNYKDDGRAIALVDWDLDGDLDLWTSNRNAPRLRFLRNDSDHKRNFLQIRLVGTSVNTPRDAIGARVTIRTRVPGTGEQSTQIKTLRAGEGFLSQSSKWLHWGLGNATEVERVNVNWPGGEEETFAGLSDGKRYELKQGTGKAVVVKRRTRQTRLEPDEQIANEATDAARIPLTSTFPLPSLVYQDWSGNDVPLVATGRPILINLWASWCAPCLEELHQFKVHREAIEQAGIRVIALSINGLGTDQTKPSAALQVIKKVEFPFTHGQATEGIVKNLQGLHDLIIRINDRPLPLPSSFLVDAKGQLSVIYRGQVSPETVIQDAASTPKTQEQLRIRSAFFPGSVIQHPRVEEIAIKKDVALRHAVVQILIRAGEHAEAVSHYREMVRLAPTRPDILSEFGDLFLLARAVDKAEQEYRNALAHDPKFPNALVGLGNIYLLRGNLPTAVKLFEAAIASDDGFAKAYLQLGVSRQLQGQPKAAAPPLKRFLELNPESVNGHTRLATVLVLLGDIETGKKHFERAVKLDAKSIEAANGLAWILATAREPNLRDGARALELASFAARATEHRHPGLLDTLAAAYAECGQFDKAIQWQKQAILILPPNQTQGLKTRLDLYQRGLPYRDMGTQR